MSCKEEKKNLQVEVSFKNEGELTIYKASTDSIIKKVDIEIADSEYEIQTGLMYRSSMKNNQGMLFIFPDVKPRAFYMKNTQFPLDLIFIDDKKTIVSFQENAKPFDESSLPSNFPAKYVLELNEGLVSKWGINVGDRISY
jgi:uncharacterized membrane protein (UPF0127 family)